MGIARRVKSFVALAAIAAGVSVAAGAGTTIAGADPAAQPAPPAQTKEDGLAAVADDSDEGCCYQRVWSGDVAAPPGAFVSAEVACPPNMGIPTVAFGGGGWNSANGDVVLTDSFPISNTAWKIYMKNNSPNLNYIMRAWVVCGMFYPINGPRG